MFSTLLMMRIVFDASGPKTSRMCAMSLPFLTKLAAMKST
jgi:hypothetical protein